MARPSVYPQEFRDRAVNLVIEATPEHTSQWAAIETTGRQLGVSGETLRKWVRRTEVITGQRAGLTDEQLEELKRLRPDNAGGVPNGTGSGSATFSKPNCRAPRTARRTTRKRSTRQSRA